MNQSGEVFVQIDPTGGDIKVRVTNGPVSKVFCVSSHVMRLASPVWRTMLDPRGHFLESQPANDREVSFLDDDPRAWEIVLLAAHIRYSDVPDKISYQELLDICHICDKYCMIEIIRPWLKGWLVPLRPDSLVPGHEGWLFIAWSIGDEDTMNRLARQIILGSTIDQDGHCLMPEDQPLEDNMPPGIVEEIMAIRLEVLAGFLALCEEVLDRYDFRHTTCSEDQMEEGACDALVLGSFIRGLQRLELWPLPQDPVSLKISINQFSTDLRNMECFTLPHRGGVQRAISLSIHENCGFRPKLGKDVDKLVEGMRSAVLISHQQHMEAQRAKLGALIYGCE